MTDSSPISLIVATWRPQDRLAELRRLLDSLVAQRELPESRPNLHEVVVVAQEANAQVLQTLHKTYSTQLPLKITTSAPGLSRARNIGLQTVTGEVVGFPDDDCWYEPTFLAKIQHFFHNNLAWDGLHTMGVSALGHPIARFAKRPSPITRTGVFTRTCSIGMFYRRSVFDVIGNFDERLGLGSGTPWEGCEDYDLPLRAVTHGFNLYYAPSLYVYHPVPASVGGSAVADHSKLRDRVARQSPSYGHVLARHRLPRWFVAQEVLRPAVGAVMAALEGETELATIRLTAARGRARGYHRTRSIRPSPEQRLRLHGSAAA